MPCRPTREWEKWHWKAAAQTPWRPNLHWHLCLCLCLHWRLHWHLSMHPGLHWHRAWVLPVQQADGTARHTVPSAPGPGGAERGVWGVGPVGLWTWKGLPSCHLAVCLHGQPKRCALLAGAVAFLACGTGFFDGELVGVAAFVCGPAALGGDFALARRIHGSKAAPRRFAVVLQGTANTTGFVCGGAATGAGRGLCRGTCSPACALVCRPGNGLGICAVACSHVFLSSGMGTAGAERRSLLQHHPQMSKMRA